MREGAPVGIVPFGKVTAEALPQRTGRLAKACRLRQLADIALDAHEPFQLDHGTDVVEHAPRNRGRAGDSEQHGQNSPARGSDERGAADPERGEDRQHIRELHVKVVVCRMGVEVGFAPPAIIEGEDAALTRAR